MCGIAGWLDARPRAPPDLDVLGRMRDAQEHRGPDDAGSWSSPDRRVALANRRLSIVDLSPLGHQPMVLDGGDVVLTYNGEVYNHPEVRAELEQLGHAFRSHCDTEVVLHAFAQWGIRCVERLRGQFAFAAYDRRDGALYLARDRVGLQPLYLHARDGLVAFASEVRGLLQHPDVPVRLNRGALYQYFVLNAPAPPFTLLEQVYVLPAGSYAVCRPGQPPELHRYWSILDEVGAVDLRGQGAEEVAGHVRRLLLQAVRRRLMSDRPVALFLSGGVDSSSVLACLAALGRGDMRTFSIGYLDEATGKTADEFAFARLASAEIGGKPTFSRSRPARLAAFAESCDWPAESLGEFLLWELAQEMLEDGIHVALHGEGSDELFFGYPFHWRVLEERLRLERDPAADHAPSFDSGVPMARFATAGPEERQALADLMFWGGGVHPRIERDRAAFFDPAAIPDTVDDGQGLDLRHYAPWSARTDVASFLEACHAFARGHPRGPDYRQRMQCVEFLWKMPEVLLRRGERSCMKRSVEMRLPFLDEDLIRLAVNIPLELLRSGNMVKAPLREAMRGLVPEPIRTRDKEFFGISFLDASRQWLRGNPALLQRLRDSAFMATGFMPELPMGEELDRLGAQRAGYDAFLWKQFFVAVWYERLLAGRSAPSPPEG